jgi:hypothetical protein
VTAVAASAAVKFEVCIHILTFWLLHVLRLPYCRLGAEREACMQLLQKAYNMQAAGRPLGIKSAVCLDHLKGFIYVEAFKDAHVRCVQRQGRSSMQ